MGVLGYFIVRDQTEGTYGGRREDVCELRGFGGVRET